MGPRELPDGFGDLAPLTAAWCLPDNQARMHAMAAADMADVQALYHAMLPRIEAIAAYLDRFPLDDLPAPEHALLELALTFAELAHVVDLQWSRTQHGEQFPTERIKLVGPSLAW